MTLTSSTLLLGLSLLLTVTALPTTTNDTTIPAALPSITPSFATDNVPAFEGIALSSSTHSGSALGAMNSPSTADDTFALIDHAQSQIIHGNPTPEHKTASPTSNEIIAFEQRAVVAPTPKHPFIELSTAADASVQCKPNQYALHSKMYKERCLKWAPGPGFVRIFWGTGYDAARRLAVYSSGDCSGNAEIHGRSGKNEYDCFLTGEDWFSMKPTW